ncbi:MAG: hypothetical protein ACLFVQ_06450 [Chitinispirillaceae bacterium]
MFIQTKTLPVILIFCTVASAGHQIFIGAAAEHFAIRDDQISHVKCSGFRIPVSISHAYQSPVSCHRGSVVFSLGSDLSHPLLFDDYTISELDLRYDYSRRLPYLTENLNLYAGASVSAFGYKGIIPYNEHYGARVGFSALVGGAYSFTDKLIISNETSYGLVALVLRPAYNLYRFNPDRFWGSIHNMICIRNDFELSYDITERYGLIFIYRVDYFSFKRHLQIKSGSDGIFLKAAVRF